MYSIEDAIETDNVNDQRRLPLEGKLSTKSTDEVFGSNISVVKQPHTSLRATFPSRGRLMMCMEQSPFGKRSFGSGR